MRGIVLGLASAWTLAACAAPAPEILTADMQDGSRLDIPAYPAVPPGKSEGAR